MLKAIIGVVAILGLVFFAGLAAAEDWHSGSYDQERGTNFADPTAYKRFIPYQGAGGDGAAGGDGGDGGGAAAGASGGSTGGDSGNGDSGGDGCGPK